MKTKYPEEREPKGKMKTIEEKVQTLRQVLTELKMEAEMLEQLNALAKAQNLSRADLIQVLIKQHIETNPVPDGRD